MKKLLSILLDVIMLAAAVVPVIPAAVAKTGYSDVEDGRRRRLPG